MWNSWFGNLRILRQRSNNRINPNALEKRMALANDVKAFMPDWVSAALAGQHPAFFEPSEDEEPDEVTSSQR